MAAVLYEPAFTVLAKHFHDAAERRRAMTAMTLVAALASFIFLPLSQALIDAYGLARRAARPGRRSSPRSRSRCTRSCCARRRADPRAGRTPRHRRRAALRSPPFWLLSGAFVLASLSTIAMTVFAIPFLLERGHSPAFAAFAVGLIGVSQIPGRMLFAPPATRGHGTCSR